MQQKYDVVPNIISGKDLDYLSDMFNWNYGAYKSNINALNNIQDTEIKQAVQKCTNVFFENMNVVLTILSEGGNNE